MAPEAQQWVKQSFVHLILGERQEIWTWWLMGNETEMGELEMMCILLVDPSLPVGVWRSTRITLHLSSLRQNHIFTISERTPTPVAMLTRGAMTKPQQLSPWSQDVQQEVKAIRKTHFTTSRATNTKVPITGIMQKNVVLGLNVSSGTLLDNVFLSVCELRHLETIILWWQY